MRRGERRLGDGQDQETPPGKAIGADDLQIWARRRNAGLSGVPDDHQQAKVELLLSLVTAGHKLDLENLRLAVHLLETLIRHLQGAQNPQS